MSEPGSKLCCALPYRVGNDDVEILLVSSRAGGWALPKGLMRPAEAPFQAAEREAWEEAGVRGTIDELPFGGFDHRDGEELEHILVYALGVDEVAADWPQSDRRRRRWTSAREASRLVPADLAPLVEDFASDIDAMFGDGSGPGFDKN